MASVLTCEPHAISLRDIGDWIYITLSFEFKTKRVGQISADALATYHFARSPEAAGGFGRWCLLVSRGVLEGRLGSTVLPVCGVVFVKVK